MGKESLGCSECPMETVALGFADGTDSFSFETRRQLMCAMEAMSLHAKHEHVISQFDCKKTSYLAVITLFEIAKNLPEYPESILYFEEYYRTNYPEKAPMILDRLFSSQAVAETKKSIVEPSPLAEEEKSITALADFTAEMLSDDDILAYTRKSGTVKQTRSNSDGSAALGPHGIVIHHLIANKKIRGIIANKCKEESVDGEQELRLEILQGIGANDIERMAPWDIGLLMGKFTCQGGDAQHQSPTRIMEMMLAYGQDTSEKKLEEFNEKYESTLVDVLAHYRKGHNDSEIGFPVDLGGGKKVFSANLTHRGIIPGAAVKSLGNLSSRPDARSDNAKEAETAMEKNLPTTWDKMVTNNSVRRIGAISLQRVSGIQTFLLAPFFNVPPSQLTPEMLADFNAIPQIRNSIFSAVFALGNADTKTFMLSNGFGTEDVPTPSLEQIRQEAEEYRRFLNGGTKPEKYSSPASVRLAHMCYQIDGCRFVLRNALTPLCSSQTKAKMENIFQYAETRTIPFPPSYHDLVINACEVLQRDAGLDLKTRDILFCVKQQVLSVREEGGFYDVRRELVQEANNAENKKAFDDVAENLAIMIRSVGNPTSPGRKVQELTKYFQCLDDLKRKEKGKKQILQSHL